ncbi:hypothetical protein [Undibacterium sp. TS12]|uniref:hypothetical protein n=1 Tax=Undibacterium sp. TS12 TaxID=2908202 RepID=UPI001F4C6CCC|nr:hypothetical protein [Undibacterium sp. TS12]MCH8619789.1 hypothetical protein [Undibacterium sp. TS12]
MSENKIPVKWTSLLHCFNIAAICSLAVWHAYAFYLNNAVADTARPHQIELLPAPAKPNHQLTT